MAPNHETPFFVSYARARDGSGNPDVPHVSDQMTRKFFADLAENVGQLISMTAGADVGYMDVGMQGGMNWPDELLHATGTCQVLIALLSARYLSSEWCGKEWCAFSRRTRQSLPGVPATPRQGHIIPVIWAPLQLAGPPPVSKEMVFLPTGHPNPDLPAEYKKNGIFGLLRTGQMDSYQIIVWQLAMLISKVYHSQRLRTRRFQLGDLHDCFKVCAHDE
jgi:TIR domain